MIGYHDFNFHILIIKNLLENKVSTERKFYQNSLHIHYSHFRNFEYQDDQLMWNQHIGSTASEGADTATLEGGWW